MDFNDIKEILTTLAAILISVAIAFLSEKKKKQSQQAEDHKQVRPASNSARMNRMATPPPMRNIPIEETKSNNSLFPEGERVTSDAPSAQIDTEIVKQKEIKLDELRRAVIWSEILTPKFKR